MHCQNTHNHASRGCEHQFKMLKAQSAKWSSNGPYRAGSFSVNDPGTRDQLRAELTRWLEYRRSDYGRLKNAGAHVTNGELRAALDAYERALERLSRFVHELEDTNAGRLANAGDPREPRSQQSNLLLRR